MEMTTLDKIVYLLESSKVPFERKTHEATLTSEDSARVRGEMTLKDYLTLSQPSIFDFTEQ